MFKGLLDTKNITVQKGIKVLYFAWWSGLSRQYVITSAYAEHINPHSSGITPIFWVINGQIKTLEDGND